MADDIGDDMVTYIGAIGGAIYCGTSQALSMAA